MTVKASIIPCLRYSDAVAAIEFLCTGFGFEKHLVVEDPDDASIIHHAQLVRNGVMIMVSSVTETEFSQVMVTAQAAGGNTQAPYVVIDDVDAHAAQARAAGAQIFMEPEDQDYGGRSYSALDPEGNAWSFGSYDPFAEAVSS